MCIRWPPRRRQAGRHTGELAPGPLLMTTSIKPPETNRYVTLARDIDLRTLAASRDAAAAIPAQVRRCGQPIRPKVRVKLDKSLNKLSSIH